MKDFDILIDYVRKEMWGVTPPDEAIVSMFLLKYPFEWSDYTLEIGRITPTVKGLSLVKYNNDIVIVMDLDSTELGFITPHASQEPIFDFMTDNSGSPKFYGLEGIGLKETPIKLSNKGKIIK